METTKARLVSIEAEQQVLGALLGNSDLYDQISGSIQAEDFSEGIHQQIFTAIAKALDAGRAVTAISMSPQFEPIFSGLGLPEEYLFNLLGGCSAPHLAKSYAGLVHNLGIRRRTIEAASQAIDNAQDLGEGDSPEPVVHALQAELDGLFTSETDDDAIHLRDAASEAVVAASVAFKVGGKIQGLSSGIRKLDEMLGGLQAGHLIVLAGRPAMGKTALALNIADHVARMAKSVLVFSLEMPAKDLAERMIATESGIPSNVIRRGQFTESQFRLIRDASNEISNLPMHIDDKSGLTIQQLASRARRFKRSNGHLDLIVIDYLQLLAEIGGRNRGRVQEVTDMTVGAKRLAKDLGVPVILLSQLNRDVERRPNKRPMLSDLRESGSIEQDADSVLFCFREHYYLTQEAPPTDAIELTEFKSRLAMTKHQADVIVAKQRHGPTGDLRLGFDAPLTRFYDPDQEAENEIF